MLRPLGRLVCRLREYHRSRYLIQGAIGDKTLGIVLPCDTCGEEPPEGRLDQSKTELVWKLQKPEDIDKELRDVLRETERKERWIKGE
jgi:hypothetical protein